MSLHKADNAWNKEHRLTNPEWTLLPGPPIDRDQGAIAAAPAHAWTPCSLDALKR
jgi:hypothetical protein